MSNKLFPGRPDYTGPIAGVFGLLHHDILVESSHDVMERVSYIKHEKPKREIATRLYNIIYLGLCYEARLCAPLIADYIAETNSLNWEYFTKHFRVNAEYVAKCTLLDRNYQTKRAWLYKKVFIYVKKHIPDCAFNGKELIYPSVKMCHKVSVEQRP